MQIKDQLNYSLEIGKSPIKIISLVPSITELLADLGLDERVCGITKFCIHPDTWFRNKERIGGTKEINIKKIRDLEPDLIIANKEENVKDQINSIKEFCNVYISDVNTIDDALEMISSIGTITNTSSAAEYICSKIQSGLNSLASTNKERKLCPNVAYLIWKEPMMAAGSGTFIDQMLTLAGYNNVFRDKERYPEITFDELRLSNIDLLFLSSEPYPFNEKHVSIFRDQIPESKIVLVDGTYFSWYGSRLVKAVDYFSTLRQNISN